LPTRAAGSLTQATITKPCSRVTSRCVRLLEKESANFYSLLPFQRSALKSTLSPTVFLLSAHPLLSAWLRWGSRMTVPKRICAYCLSPRPVEEERRRRLCLVCQVIFKNHHRCKSFQARFNAVIEIYSVLKPAQNNAPDPFIDRRGLTVP
jgi:hypothetical protein